jgi:hypothetical protein
VIEVQVGAVDPQGDQAEIVAHVPGGQEVRPSHSPTEAATRSSIVGSSIVGCSVVLRSRSRRRGRFDLRIPSVS